MLCDFIYEKKNPKSEIRHQKPKIDLSLCETLKAPTDAVHLPIIRLAQYSETKGAMFSVGSNPYRS